MFLLGTMLGMYVGFKAGERKDEIKRYFKDKLKKK